MNNATISQELDRYLARFPDETHHLPQFASALKERDPITGRANPIGHVTCAAIVLDDAGRALVVHHNSEQKLLFPGGHLESDDIDLLEGARREMVEETGVAPDAVEVLLDGLPIDIDEHEVRGNPSKQEGRHTHYNFFYAFRLKQPVTLIAQVGEVSDVKFVELDEIPSLVSRLKEKIKALQ